MKRKSLSFLLPIVVLFVVGCASEENKTLIVSEKIHPALQMLPVPAGLGVNIHFFEGNKKDLSMLKESGVGIVRMDISWGSVEKSKGKYDFSRHDKLIEDLDKLGIRLLFIIDYGNPNYDDGLAPHTPEGREAYAKFCAALAERYSGKDIIWELWNEPNIDKFWLPAVNVDNYMAFCKAVVPVIREKDQNACIIAPATSAFDMKFMESCFEQGLLDLVDGVSVHPYRNPELSPETAFDEYQLLSLLIEQHKPEEKAIPILSGEWGYSTFHLSRKLQGKYLARQWLSNFAYDIPISIWYDWHDDGQDPEEAEHNFGTITWDYKAKPSFIAMKTLIEQFRGYQAIGRVGLGSVDDYLLLFQKNDEVKLALWSTSDIHRISLGKDIQILQGVNYLGKNISNINSEEIKISDEPIYLNIEQPYPDWINVILEINDLTSTEIQNLAQGIINEEKQNKVSNKIFEFLRGNNPQQFHAALYTLIVLANKINTDDALSIYYLILDLGKDVLSSKQALIKIAKIGSKGSVEKVTTKMKDANLMKEASLYYLNLAYIMVINGKYNKAENLMLEAIKFSPPRYAMDRILSRMQKSNKNIDTNTYKKMARSAGFMNDWQVVGPFSNKNKLAERTEYLYVKSIDTSKPIKYGKSKLKWQKLILDGVFPVIPLAKLYGREESAAYAYAEITFDESFPAILKVGSNDGVVCWINGKKVHEKFIGRALTIDEDIVKVNFKKGNNTILLKVLNQGNAWEACLRVCDSKGVPLDISNR